MILTSFCLQLYICFLTFRLLLLVQVRELETMLEEEKTQRAQALTVKKQLETELQEAEAQVEAANRGREEALRQMKRLQVCQFSSFLNKPQHIYKKVLLRVVI